MLRPRRSAIVAQARDLVAMRWPDTEDCGGACLFAAAAMQVCAARAGHRLVVQAGTMSWLMVAPALDDGVGPTHFTFEWDPTSPLSLAAVAAGYLPEIHIWLGDPVTHEVVDITTRDFPRLAKLMEMPEWSAPEPPDHLWQRQLPPEAVYRPNRDATLYAHAKMADILKNRWIVR